MLKEKQRNKVSTPNLDTPFLIEWEKWMLKKYSLLGNLPFFKNYRSGKAYEKWSRDNIN